MRRSFCATQMDAVFYKKLVYEIIWTSAATSPPPRHISPRVAENSMKGTNPETQGHRWAKRVKKRLKVQQREDGQWEDLDRKKEREAEELAAAAATKTTDGDELPGIDPGDADTGTELRDEEGLPEAELAAVRLVKEAAQRAEDHYARAEKQTKDKADAKSNKSATKPNTFAPKKAKAQVSSNPYAALNFGRIAVTKKEVDLPKVTAEGGTGDGVQGVTTATEKNLPPTKRKAGETQLQARNRLAAEGSVAASLRKQKLGINGVSGQSAKKLKKQLKRARQAAVE